MKVEKKKKKKIFKNVENSKFKEKKFFKKSLVESIKIIIFYLQENK